MPSFGMNATMSLAQVSAAQAPLGFSFSPVRPLSAALRLAALAMVDPLHQRRWRPYIRAMQQHLDPSDEEATALVAPLPRTIADDRYPRSPRIRTLKASFGKLRSDPARVPMPAPRLCVAARHRSPKAPAWSIAGEQRRSL